MPERLLRQQLFECQLQLKATKVMKSERSIVNENTTGGLSLSYRFPRHLLEPHKPSYLQSKGRNNVSIVLGILTVCRQKMFTLRATLYNLIENMNEQEQNDTLIVVHIGESNEDEVQKIVEQIERSFQQQLNKGLIDIIAPAANYYSDMDMSWQSKQNLDLAYLMAYAHAKGVFYVQLVDDIMTRRQFVTSMKRFALIKSALANPFQPSWIVLDFCEVGFIGKLFKATELPYLITYLQLYYNDMNALDVLTHLIEAKMCRQVKKDKLQCQHLKTKLWQRFNSNLFYHIENISLEDKLKLELGRKDQN
ncbi:hypothetical protein KR215_001371 [Drosophila sulfurigaster]|nr:hypothetical protein KR215_001371 [Drosophila sulfurigaster]